MASSEIELRKQREQKVRDWIAATRALVPVGIALPQIVGRCQPIYTTMFGREVFDAMLDGHVPSKTWTLSSRVGPSTDLLFSGLDQLVSACPACWIVLLCHDDCYWECRSVHAAEPGYLRRGTHRLLRTQIADEGGSTAIGLLFEDFRSLFFFTNQVRDDLPDWPREYRIDYQGDPTRLAELQRHVETTAGIGNGKDAKGPRL